MLTPERIHELWENYSPTKGIESFVRSVEAEVRKDDEALIRQMLEALEKSNSEWKELADSGDAGYWKAEDQTHYQRSEAAITAARDRLEKAP